MRLPESPLYLTESEALTILGQPAVALRVIGEGLVRAEAAGDRLMVVNLRLLQTLILDGQWASPPPPEPVRHAPALPAPPPPGPPARPNGQPCGHRPAVGDCPCPVAGGGGPADFAAVDEDGLVIALAGNPVSTMAAGCGADCRRGQPPVAATQTAGPGPRTGPGHASASSRCRQSYAG